MPALSSELTLSSPTAGNLWKGDGASRHAWGRWVRASLIASCVRLTNRSPTRFPPLPGL